MKEKFYKYFWESWIDWNINRGVSFCLTDLYWPFIQDVLKIKVDDNNIKELWQNKEYHEKFFSYLEELLKNWEIKMRILEDNWEIKIEESWNRCIYWKIENPKDFWKENYKEWLKLLKEEWNSIDDDLLRRHFEDMLVLFILPENNFS